MTIVFANKEPIDLDLISIMGASVKNSSSAIGYFGTGLKYAIAVCIRHDCSITLIREGVKYSFRKVKKIVRDTELELIYMNDIQLPFTSDYGKNWELWMAFRELYSNVLDEGGEAYLNPSAGLINSMGTAISVEGEEFEKIYLKKDKYFLQKNRIPLVSLPKYNLEIYEGETNSVFLKGVRVHTSPRKYAFTYNILGGVNLTEDRSLPFYAGQAIIRNAFPYLPVNIIEEILRADKDSNEQINFDYDSVYFLEDAETETFFELVEKHSSNIYLNKSLVQELYARKRRSRKFVYFEPDAFQKSMLFKAFELLNFMGIDMSTESIKYVETLGTGVHGLASLGNIFIPRVTFDKGVLYLASTLYEEYLHINNDLVDESRPMQNFLFDKLFYYAAMAKELSASPLSKNE